MPQSPTTPCAPCATIGDAQRFAPLLAMRRRQFLLTPLAFATASVAAEVVYPRVEAGIALAFPRDHGSHPAFRTEWWYITGWVTDDAGHDFGVQITFFRSRTAIGEASTSRFAPRTSGATKGFTAAMAHHPPQAPQT